MRLFMTLFLLCAAALLRAETAGEIFTKGYRFYLNSDYHAAAEMFRQIADDSDGELSAWASYYLGSILAFDGDKDAKRLFVRAMKNPKIAQPAAVQFAKFCLANGDFTDAAKTLSALPPAERNSEIDYYAAFALAKSGRADEAKEAFAKLFERDFADKNAAGVDMIIDEFSASKKPALAGFNPLAAAEKIAANSKTPLPPAAAARLAILEKSKIASAEDVSFYAKIIAGEQNPPSIDKKTFADEILKNKNSPFAWRAALLLGRTYLNAGDYKNAEILAKDCLRLAVPDTVQQWRGQILLADCYRLLKNYDAARDEYQKVYMNHRARGEILAETIYKTGLCWFEQGHWADAHACFERVFVAFFRYEYWGSRAYYYDAQALYSLHQRRDANATLLEYFRRAKDRQSPIYKKAREYYNSI